MLSKFLRPVCVFKNTLKLLNNVPSNIIFVRNHFIPPNQYDSPVPDKFKFGYIVSHHWETIPLFACTFIALTFLFVAIIWAMGHKVDVVYSTHNRDSISRTMDLRCPTVHKMVIICQKYEPWPEMQEILDKMRLAEHRALVRAQACSIV